MPETKREPFFNVMVLKWLTGAAISIIISITSAVWTVRGAIAAHDQNIVQQFSDLEKTLTEKMVISNQGFESETATLRQQTTAAQTELTELHNRVDKDMVSRTEQQTHWDEERGWHDDLKDDLRDLDKRIDSLNQVQPHSDSSR